jgi:hypothetical protein
VDHVERDQRRHQGRREAREHAELLRDPQVVGSGGDGDADPDRPAGEERREEQLGEQVRSLQERRRHRRTGEELDAGQEQGVDDIGDDQGWDGRRERLAQQQLLAPDRRGEHGSSVPCWRSPTTA